MKHVKPISAQPPQKASIISYLQCKKNPMCAIAKPAK
jgi:hypothetical protein